MNEKKCIHSAPSKAKEIEIADAQREIEQLVTHSGLLLNHTKYLQHEAKRLDEQYKKELSWRREAMANPLWPAARAVLWVGNFLKVFLGFISNKKGCVPRSFAFICQTQRPGIRLEYEIPQELLATHSFTIKIGNSIKPASGTRPPKDGTEFIGADINIGQGLKYIELLGRPRDNLGARPEVFQTRLVWREAPSWVRALLPKISSPTHDKMPLDLGVKAKATGIKFDEYDDPLISVCIPCYQNTEMTLTTLDSLQRNSICSLEVILSDDSPDEELRSQIAKTKRVHYFKNEGSPGFVNNCNTAATKATGKYLFFLNNDTVVQTGWDQALVAAFDKDPKIGLVGAKLVYPDGSLQEAGGIIWSDGSGWNFGKNKDPNGAEFNFRRETDYCSAAAILIRRDLFEKIGGFDTRYCPAYYEDTDLSFEVRKHGFKTVYEPKSIVVHFEGKSNGIDENSNTGLKRYQKLNKTKFIEKWASVLAAHPKPGSDPWHAKFGAARECRTALIIDHHVPFIDQDAGSRSTFQYIQLFLELEYRITFIGDNFYPHKPYTERLQELGVEVLYGDYYYLNIMNWLSERADRFDLVFANRSHITVKYIEVLQTLRDAGSKVLYYGHDLGSVRNERAYAITQNEKDLENAKMDLENEKEIFTQVDAVYFPSTLETEHMQKHYPKINAFTLPLNIIKPQRNMYIPSIRERNDMMFVGGFGHPPNEDAVLWFVENCWPRIKKEYAQAAFHIVGSKPSEKVQALAKDPCITVTGWVSDEDLEALYSTIKLVIVPLRYGAGVKGKVVETLERSIPSILTPIAAEGITGIEKASQIALDEPATFSDAIISIYNNRERLENLSRNASEVVEANFSKARAISAIKAGIA